MGQITPFMGIFIPSAGDTNYEQSFAAGMINVDQHDHSGGPNKGVPITASGLANFSVTYQKLNSNVADTTTGIGTQGSPFQNRLQTLGILNNLYQLAGVPSTGFVSMNGHTVAARTFQNTATLSWTNPSGGGNPSADVLIAGLSPIAVANGGTGRTSLFAYQVICGGTTSTAAVQSIGSVGTSGQVLTSQGAGMLPSWQDIPAITQNFQIATITMTASQVRNLVGTPQLLIPAPGAGKVIIVTNLYGKLVFSSSTFGAGSAMRLYYGVGLSTEVGFQFNSGAFKDSFNGYYYAANVQSASSSGIATASMENQAVYVSVGSTDYSGGGASNTVSLSCQYSIMQI